ncbi:hypothetical protein MWU59_06515 [Flavobacteriaceae bacterium F08102]|nr:hypothetical protein [Flavobacteriaceae bacterium F08102]
MRKLIVLGSFLGFLSLSCQGQVEKSTQEKNENKPKTSYQVHKEYDEDGNLIRLDSTYSYVYSNTTMDPEELKEFMKNFNKMSNFSDLDSLFNFGSFQIPSDFRKFFQHNFGMRTFTHKSFEDFFKKFDSIHRPSTTDTDKTLPIR